MILHPPFAPVEAPPAEKEAAVARAKRIGDLLRAMPDYEDHVACGVTGRPCADCRRCAALECIDPEQCGLTCFCRPCAATTRVRLWRVHLRHVREFHCAIERYPMLAALHQDQETLAAWWYEANRAIYRRTKRRVSRWLTRELPAVIRALVEARP